MKINTNEWPECPVCNGDGKDIENMRCLNCKGRGRITPDHTKHRSCGQCEGTGYLIWGGATDADAIATGRFSVIQQLRAGPPYAKVHVELCSCGGEDYHCKRCGGARLLVLDESGHSIEGADANECHYCGGSGLVLATREDA